MPSRRHRVAVLAFEGISQFHLSVPQLVFGLGALSQPVPHYNVTVCIEGPRRIHLSGGLSLRVPAGLEAFEDADVVVLPSWHPPDPPSPKLLAAVRRAHKRGTLIVGLCLGGWVVAASGIVDGRTVATHWNVAQRLADTYPLVSVQPDVLWCDLGDVVTSAGVAAALDCCLHIVRNQCGSSYATEVARQLVMAPHRTGSQAQYIPTPILRTTSQDPIDEAMRWARARLDEHLDLETWACSTAMSRRNFTRRFTERTGTSPMRWLLAQRVDHARRLLETTDEPIEQVAAHAGFGSVEALRYHFRSALGVSPTTHRAAFQKAA